MADEIRDPAGNAVDLVQHGDGAGDDYKGSGSKSGTKAELLAQAQEKGLDVSDSNTKAEIQSALDAAE